jgi:hypothetical protein
MLERCFKNNNFMDYKTFLYTIENISSDIYLFVLLFLMQKRPFTNVTLDEYEKQKSSFLKVNSSPVNCNKLLASPNKNSKFIPSLTIMKSPRLGSSLRLDNKGESQNVLLKMTGLVKEESKRTELKSKTVQYKNDNLKINLIEPTVPVNRKVRNNLKEIDNVKEKERNNRHYDEFEIFPAVKMSDSSLSDFGFDEPEEDIRHEGFLHKLTDQKQVKRLWFKLIHKDLYCKTI